MRHEIGRHAGYVIEASDRLKATGKRGLYIVKGDEDVLTIPPRDLSDPELLEIGTWAIDSMIRRGCG
ncbi:hypothetical protein DOP62_14285 (plasmid) [Synechococcus elongatus PCC 11801]|uniref:Uncharacterized protein n=1 Tax=Synechococcus elongatus PCC 11801 TaxID=2219813 RepID=A0ACD5A363_SYNEL